MTDELMASSPKTSSSSESNALSHSSSHTAIADSFPLTVPTRINFTYRNRHGRGQRRPTFEGKIPQYRTSAALFDQIVACHLHRLHRKYPHLMDRLHCTIEDIPPHTTRPWEEEYILRSDLVDISKEHPHLVIYRRPLKTLSYFHEDLVELIYEEIDTQIGKLLGIPPSEVSK